MTDIEKVRLSIFLALIATLIFNFLYRLISSFIVDYRILGSYKKQFTNGEITKEEYKRKVNEFVEKASSGESD